MVTIPTIDQISGTTVMNKMRSLINAFINFGNDVDGEFDNYYTKIEIDEMAYNFVVYAGNGITINQYSPGNNRHVSIDSVRVVSYIPLIEPLDVGTKQIESGSAWAIKLNYTTAFTLDSNNALDINADNITSYLRFVNNSPFDVSRSSQDNVYKLNFIYADKFKLNTRGNYKEFDLRIDNNTIKEDSITHNLYCDISSIFTAGDGISINNGFISTRIDGTSIVYDNGVLKAIADTSDFYTKIEIDNILDDYYTDSEIDTLLNAKQNVLTAGDNITIVGDVISAMGSEWNLVTSQVEFNNLFTTYTTNKDMLLVYCYSNFKNTVFIPKGTYINAGSSYLPSDVSIAQSPNNNVQVGRYKLEKNSNNWRVSRTSQLFSIKPNQQNTYYTISFNETAGSVNLTLRTTIDSFSEYLYVYWRD